MGALNPNFYEQWRDRAHGLPTLCDARGGGPPEKLLQQIWQHQRVLRDELRTVDGRRVRVVHPGFWNKEPGPDFRDAIIQIEGAEPQIGHVEIDLQSTGWKGHGHAT